jgi:phosphatidate cytidylyltransferase
VEPIEWIGVTSAASFVLLAAWRPVFQEYAPFALGVVIGASLIAAIEAMRTRGPDGHPLSAAAVTVFGEIYTGLSLGFIPLLLALPVNRAWGTGTADPLASLYIVALPLVATWVGDAAAYFAGTAWGKGRARLAPTISPNKSWVGFWANLAGGAVAGVAWHAVTGGRLPGLAEAGLLPFALIGAVLGFAAVIGDLLESVFKREAGVKDSGTLFPGHGGVLDRVDSLIFTIPASYGLLILLASLT